MDSLGRGVDPPLEGGIVDMYLMSVMVVALVKPRACTGLKAVLEWAGILGECRGRPLMWALTSSQLLGRST